MEVEISLWNSCFPCKNTLQRSFLGHRIPSTSISLYLYHFGYIFIRQGVLFRCFLLWDHSSYIWSICSYDWWRFLQYSSRGSATPLMLFWCLWQLILSLEHKLFVLEQLLALVPKHRPVRTWFIINCVLILVWLAEFERLS